MWRFRYGLIAPARRVAKPRVRPRRIAARKSSGRNRSRRRGRGGREPLPGLCWINRMAGASQTVRSNENNEVIGGERAVGVGRTLNWGDGERGSVGLPISAVVYGFCPDHQAIQRQCLVVSLFTGPSGVDRGATDKRSRQRIAQFGRNNQLLIVWQENGL